MNRIRIGITSLALVVALAACVSFQRGSYFTIDTIATAVLDAKKGFEAYETQCKCVAVSADANVAVNYAKYQQAMAAASAAVVAYKSSANPNRSQLEAVLDAASASAGQVFALIESLLPPDESAKLKTKVPKNAKITVPQITGGQ